MLENNFTVMLAVTKLDSIKNKLFSTADSLYFNKKISKHFYELIKLQSDAQFLFSLESSIQNSLDKISLSNKNIYLNKAQLLSIEIQKIYYNRYDPFSSIYNSIDQNLRIINCQNKCRLIENRILSGEKKDIGLWTRPDEQSYSFAPIALQHTMMAIHLSYNGFYKLDRGNLNDSADFELLKKNFPNSPYIPILNRYFKKKIDYFDYK